jgi:hypothetical protein
MTLSLHHPKNVHQLSINAFWSCILGNLMGDSFCTAIKQLLAAFIGKRDCNTFPTPS